MVNVYFVLESLRESRHELDSRAVRIVALHEHFGVLRSLSLTGRVSLGRRPYGRRRHGVAVVGGRRDADGRCSSGGAVERTSEKKRIKGKKKR